MQIKRLLWKSRLERQSKKLFRHRRDKSWRMRRTYPYITRTGFCILRVIQCRCRYSRDCRFFMHYPQWWGELAHELYSTQKGERESLALCWKV